MTDTVEIPAELARVALRELEIVIEETDDPEGEGSDEGPMSPLARARLRVSRLVEEKHGDLGAGLGIARNRIDQVGEETGADVAPHDPLQDDVFRARDALYDAFKED